MKRFLTLALGIALSLALAAPAVVGGTGRFEGATGSGDGSGYSILASSKTTMSLWGEIRY